MEGGEKDEKVILHLKVYSYRDDLIQNKPETKQTKITKASPQKGKIQTINVSLIVLMCAPVRQCT